MIQLAPKPRIVKSRLGIRRKPPDFRRTACTMFTLRTILDWSDKNGQSRRKNSEKLLSYFWAVNRQDDIAGQSHRWHKDDYQKNKASYDKKRKRFRAERAEWLWKLKCTLQCKECGEKHPICLDFHHRDRALKDGLVSRLVKRASIKKVLVEIEKCDALCANCHRKLHRGINCSKRSKWFWELKCTLQCKKCNEKHPACLDFHHRDFSVKENNVSQLVYRVSKEKVLAEIEKCDILCANCHRKFHCKRCYQQEPNNDRS
jgi:hypothetical protein